MGIVNGSVEICNGKIINIKDIRAMNRLDEDDSIYYGIWLTRDRFYQHKVLKKHKWEIKEFDYLMENNFTDTLY